MFELNEEDADFDPEAETGDAEETDEEGEEAQEPQTGDENLTSDFQRLSSRFQDWVEPELGRIEEIQGDVTSHYSELRRNHQELTTELGNVQGVSQRFGAYMDQWDSQY